MVASVASCIRERNLQMAALGNAEVTSKFRDGDLLLRGVNEKGNQVDVAIKAEQLWTGIAFLLGGAGEFFTYDATNFRVREVSFSYDVPIPARFTFKQVRISAVARNLFFLYRGSSVLNIPAIGKRKMAFDPDMAMYNNNFQGR